MKHLSEKKNVRINIRKYVLSFLVILIILFSSLTAYSYTQKQGEYDEFAKCLANKGAIIYGNDYCSYTNKQLNFFGKSKKYLNYIKCADNQNLCDEKGIKITPTWEIDEKFYEQIQTFETLSILTGCEI
ncbi:MAG TPA: hypothetical protein VJH65_02330 [Candidatus Nanoarchaeia archaeon]|nr:hypothetical protein [Candidatus Nanoarchaeia archaeon]